MKTLTLSLAALLSISSALADTGVKLTEKGGTQTLTLTLPTRSGQKSSGVMSELPNLLMNAKNVIRVKRGPDGTSYDGQYVSGYSACPGTMCTRVMEISQKRSGRQVIVKSGEDTYTITGDAARELYEAGADAGLKPHHTGSKSPSILVTGDTFRCSANPLGGLHYICTLEINQNP